MTNEELDTLDKFISQLSNSTNAQEPEFNADGYPVERLLDRDVLEETEKYIMAHSPSFLYKYKKGTEYDLEALWNDKMWLSTLKEYNDPYEAQFAIDCDTITMDLINSDDNLLRLMQQNGITKDHPIYRKLLSEVSHKTQTLKKEIEMKMCRLFTSCFSESKTSLLMWAHYANSHKGICICYRYTDLTSMYGPLNIMPIRYSNKLLKVDSVERETYHSVFLRICQTKSTEWAYEKEWRLLGEYKLNDPYSSGCLIDGPVPHSIYLGACVEENVKKAVYELCKCKDIKLYQMRLSDVRYGLLSYPIRK